MRRASHLHTAGVWLRYFVALQRGRPAGDYSYISTGLANQALSVEVKLPADGSGAVEQEIAARWCALQTLPTLSAVGYLATGRPAWRVGQEMDHPATWFMAPAALPTVYPAFVESAVLVAAAEEVDAVTLTERLDGVAIEAPADLLHLPARAHTLFDAEAYSYVPDTRTVRPSGSRQRIKLLDNRVGDNRREPHTFHRFRRGPYISLRPLPPRLQIGLRDLPSPLPVTGDRPRLLVTVPFLARGGAEHTLFETLKILRQDFDISIASLAPHRPELGDRRADFHQITDRIYCLGDLVHPAAMPAILGWLMDRLNIDILYNANSTTLFYDFGPTLKTARPQMRIVDHLYDHRVGYVERYEDPSLLNWIDACVAENHRIAKVLIEERAWPVDRVPVVWPCGRPRDAFPAKITATRQEVRRELGLNDADIVFLIAARMHVQKRPLDIVALARRVRDLPGIQFLVVGGGDLEAEVDAAIADAPDAPIRRLSFRDDIPRLIAAADVGCLVSEYEGLPVFMLECLQVGRPFLGTDVGDMGTVLKASGAGHVVEQPGDLDALEAGVRRLHDPATLAMLGTLALKAGEEFDVKRCAERYAEALMGK